MNNVIDTYTVASKELTMGQKVGQLFMPPAFINDTEEEVQKLEELIRTKHIGALCFFHSRASAATNFEGKKKVVYNENSYDRLKGLIQRYQSAAKIPLLIAIDAEWGLAMRVENTPQYPYAITLGAIQDNQDLIYQVGRQIGMDCLHAGIHWNLSPVVDINNNPENPVIGYRSFGDDKEKVLSKARAYLQGLSGSGVLNSIKHFPGHGDTATDSHLGLPVIDKSKKDLLDNELYPFKKLIEEGVDSVMVGHLSVPSLDPTGNPATTSYAVITELLRKEFGFDGVIISDALNMHAVSKNFDEKGALETTAFLAGMDMMCFTEHPSESIEKIRTTASPERIETSFERIWKLKERAFANTNTKKQHANSHGNLNRQLAAQSISVVNSTPQLLDKARTGKFVNLSAGNPTANQFSKALEKEFGSPHLSLEDSNMAEPTDEILVLALFPPSVKSKNNFGLGTRLLDTINAVLEKQKVVLYLFGNPYVLDILELNKESHIVAVYQDFPEFQELALAHFKGEAPTLGQLPVQLKTFVI
nr:glycoside hydrolase family 3 protein [Allomuricauda sp.]